MFGKAKKTALLPAVLQQSPFPGTRLSTFSGTFGVLVFLSLVAGGPNSNSRAQSALKTGKAGTREKMSLKRALVSCWFARWFRSETP